METKKKSIKRKIITAIIVIAAIPVLYIDSFMIPIFIGQFEYTRRTCVEDFEAHRADFDTVADVAWKNRDQVLNERFHWFYVISDENERIRLYNANIKKEVQITAEEQKSLDVVYSCFKYLNTVWIGDNEIAFDTSEHENFNLIYTRDGKKPKEFPRNKDEYRVYTKKLGGGWYSATLS